MPVEMGMWRVDGATPRRLSTTALPTERELESYLAVDPSLLGQRLLVIGRQVHTPHGKYIDLLAVDVDGNLHVLELKRDRTPRDVVAQILDYGSWVTSLDRDEIVAIARRHLEIDFEVAFEETFSSPPPDELNGGQQLTIVASEFDPSSERIVGYLRDFGVPVNAVFFNYLEDDGRRYLARSWLVAADEGPTSGSKRAGKRADWNGQDWFVSFGEGQSRSWNDARRYGFVSAGGDQWYSRTLRNIPVGARLFVHIPKMGYVGVAEALRTAVPFDEAEVTCDGQPKALRDLPLDGTYHRYESATEESGEYVVAVRWLQERPREQAYWEKGMFANQNSACKLRQQFTLDRLATHFDLDQTAH